MVLVNKAPAKKSARDALERLENPMQRVEGLLTSLAIRPRHEAGAAKRAADHGTLPSHGRFSISSCPLSFDQHRY